MGVLGLHLPEEYGGSGGDLTDLAVAVEDLGRAVTPGALVPTVVASAVLASEADDAAKKTHLPALPDGARTAGIAPRSHVEVRDGTATGTGPAPPGGGGAALPPVAAGADSLPVGLHAPGARAAAPPTLSASRRSARVTVDGVAVTTLTGASATLRDLARVVLSAE